VPENRPYVILNAAMSIDGKIATRGGRARISSEEDLKRVQLLRSQVDAIMVGINTVLVDDPSLRLKLPSRGRPPVRVIVDSTLRTPPQARIFSYPGRIVIATSQRAMPEAREVLAKKAHILVAGRKRVDLQEALKRLWEMGIKRMLLEGGGNLNWGMMESGLVDEIRIAIAPIVIGGRDVVTLVEGKGILRVEEAFAFQVEEVSRLGPDVVLTFRRRKGA